MDNIGVLAASLLFQRAKPEEPESPQTAGVMAVTSGDETLTITTGDAAVTEQCEVCQGQHIIGEKGVCGKG